MPSPFLEKEEVPSDWREGYLIKLPKKGDLSNCSNYRGITLLSAPGKVFNRITLERMKGEIGPWLRDHQAGFRSNRSRVYQIAIHIQDNYHEFCSDPCSIFISTRNQATADSNAFISPEAFSQYSQLAQVLDFITAKDELLKKQHEKHKSLAGRKVEQASQNKTSVKGTKSKKATNKNKKQNTKEALSTSSGDFGQPKVVIRIHFPHLSCLTKKQHADYLRLSKKFLGNPPAQRSSEDIKEINMFKELQVRVQQEQDEFMNYLKMVASQSVGDYNYLHPEAARFITDYLRLEHQRVTSYPCFYRLFDDVPLSGQKSTEIMMLSHDSILLEMGHVSRIIQPKIGFQNKVSVPLNYSKVNASFPVSEIDVRKLPPCSQDPNCIALAKKYDADVVMCASAMACLLDNHAPLYNRQWEIPFKVVISENTASRSASQTLFLDKPFVPKVPMPREKSEWYHKSATKTLFQHPRHNTSFLLESLKGTNNGTCKQDKQDACFSVTEQITDLEVFGTENPAAEMRLKDFKLSYGNTEDALTSESCIKISGRETEDSSSSSHSFKMPQTDIHFLSSSDNSVEVPKADVQALSSSSTSVNLPQASIQDISSGGNSVNLPQASLQDVSSSGNSVNLPQASLQDVSTNGNYGNLPQVNLQDVSSSGNSVNLPQASLQDVSTSGNSVNLPQASLKAISSSSNSVNLPQVSLQDMSSSDNSVNLPQASLQDVSTNGSSVNLPQVNLQDVSSSGNSVNLPQASLQDVSTSGNSVNLPQASLKAISSSSNSVNLPQASLQDVSTSGNSVNLPQASLQSDAHNLLANEDYSMLPEYPECEDRKTNTDPELHIIGFKRQEQLPSELHRLKPEAEGVSQFNEDEHRSEISSARKMESDLSNARNIVDITGKNLDNNDPDEDMDCVADQTIDVDDALNFSGDSSDDTEDERLVIDAPGTPKQCQKSKDNSPDTFSAGRQIFTEDDPRTLLSDCAGSPAYKRQVCSDNPASPCPDTPLSPQYVPAPNTPSHTPEIPLEKLDVSVVSLSQRKENGQDDIIHVRSSKDTPTSPPGGDTINSGLQDCYRSEKPTSGGHCCHVAASSSDTENELIIDMGKDEQFISCPIKTEIGNGHGNILVSSSPVVAADYLETTKGGRIGKLVSGDRKQLGEYSIKLEQPAAFKSEVDSQLVVSEVNNEMPFVESNTSSERVYNLRKRQIAVSPNRTPGLKTEEPKPKRRTRSHTAALPVDRMLMRQTRAMSRQQSSTTVSRRQSSTTVSQRQSSTTVSQRQSSTTVSQLDGTDDRQNEQTKTKTQIKPPSRTAKCEQNTLTSPLDNILDAQSKLLDGSFISCLPSQVQQIPYLDAGQATCFLGNGNMIQGQGHTVPGQGNLIPGQGSNIPGQGSMIPDHMVSRIGMNPAQVGVIPGQVDKISGQLNMTPRQSRMTTGQTYGDRLFQGGALENANDYQRPPTSNINYSLFTLGDLRIIIRYKYHGVLKYRKKNPMQFAHIQTKLEYQPQYGMEQMTHSEICKAWLALQLRPHTSLLRVRVNAYTGEIMEQKLLTANDILPQRSPFHPGYAMCNLYRILQKLKKLPCGDFLLSHNPGQLSCHIKTTTQSTSGVYDLHKAYLQQSNPTTNQYTETTVPWIPIDPGQMLPFHNKYQCIPAMFEPKDSEGKHTFKPGQNKKKKKKKKKASG
ncbi:hypothetical protein LSH36_5g11026 [Paralvinella palmiformis]|uniref:Little elongation complex subunit 2 C-terminal domain-containing protein n=1 Tax=Paralvinella palmiformis TaxID=53620 RepID=A0AAD9KFV0_9ANNE|nr:hypothetical protein LSH36_5g11026 [Paralvinella palmiformis]